MTGIYLKGLRTKLVFMVAMGMLALFAMQLTAARVLLLKGFSQLELDKTLIQIGSAVSLLNNLMASPVTGPSGTTPINT